jgi:tripartite-type tricarboxylate transporter receptor subunit TctC
VIAALAKAAQSAVEAPDLKQRLQDQGVELKFTPATEFGQVIEQEFRTWGKAVEVAKVKLD